MTPLRGASERVAADGQIAIAGTSAEVDIKKIRPYSNRSMIRVAVSACESISRLAMRGGDVCSDGGVN